MKTIRSTNALASTRARLGLTQEQIGMHLGISKSMVKLVETNRRHLASARLIKLAGLEIQLTDFQQNKTHNLPPSMQELYSKEKSSYELEARYQEGRCTQHAKQLEKKLQKMEMEYAKIKASLHNLDAMAEVKLDTSDVLFKTILHLRPKLLNKLTKCSLQAQDMTKKKIALLYAEAGLNNSIHPRNIYTNEKPILSQLKQTNMDYTVSMISNRPDCQAMIDAANDDKDSLVYRKTGLERQMQSASTTTVSIDADSAAAIAEISALETVIAGLPEGSVKEETKVKLTKAQYKKFLLDQRKANFGSVALVGKEYTIACVDQSITETDAFILALTTRMNELPAV
ncbi:MAG: helix-turn-helix transcriptional regulator [Ferruginibacter sp.]